MDRLKLHVPLVLLLIPGVILVGLAQDQLTIDASKQPSPPARGRGPFSPSVGPGHSAYLPIRLELRIQSGPLQPDGTTLIDFVITNTGEGDDVILLPSSIKESDGPSSYVLNLWFTSDAVKDAYFKDTASGRPVKIEIVSLSAQLFGRSNEPHSFLPVAANQSMKVHASSRVQLQPGKHTATAHAELLHLVARDSSISSEVVGTADSETITATLSATEQNHHVKEWTERNALYSQPRFVQSKSSLKVDVNSPTPLDDVLAALAMDHGWRINYEDPRYAKADLVDNTAPSWLREHPNGDRVFVVAGGAFHSRIPLDGYFPDDPSQILPALVEAYNRSGNPGHFELRPINQNQFDVVPTATSDGPQKPILDTVMSFDTKESDSADSSFEAFCKALTRASGESIGFWRFFVTGTSYFSEAARIRLHVQNQPAREVLRRMLGQVTSTKSWRLAYDPNLRRFLLMFR